MSIDIFTKLAEKIDFAVETIEFQRLQLEEMEEKINQLQNENTQLKGKASSWEDNLNTMLKKFDHVDTTVTNSFTQEKEIA